MSIHKLHKKSCRRKYHNIANRFQRKILTLVFFSTVVPMVIAVVCLYYLILNAVADEMAIPEAIGYTLIPAAQKSAVIATIGFLVSVLIIWAWALRVSHQLAGPLERLCRDLDDRICGRKKGYVYFRKKDYLAILAGRINSLLDKAHLHR
ncbi:MAG TPA: hypothetical protein VJA84_02770 [Candidatus Omnitrophota bacterium]|nr:hypothetical protein [Candidatus Omnitrophota bacterium]